MEIKRSKLGRALLNLTRTDVDFSQADENCIVNLCEELKTMCDSKKSDSRLCRMLYESLKEVLVAQYGCRRAIIKGEN